MGQFWYRRVSRAACILNMQNIVYAGYWVSSAQLTDRESTKGHQIYLYVKQLSLISPQ